MAGDPSSRRAEAPTDSAITPQPEAASGSSRYVMLKDAIRQVRNGYRKGLQRESGLDVLEKEKELEIASTALRAVVEALGSGKIAAGVRVDEGMIGIPPNFWNIGLLTHLSRPECELLAERNMTIDAWAARMGSILPKRAPAGEVPILGLGDFKKWLGVVLHEARSRATASQRRLISRELEKMYREKGPLEREPTRETVRKALGVKITDFAFREAERIAAKGLDVGSIYRVGRPPKKL